MTPEEVRAEAIDRIARADYAAWKRDFDLYNRGVPVSDYDDAHADPARRAADRRARVAVDALGDMLPTGVEVAPLTAVVETFAGIEIATCRTGPLRARWTHDWTEVFE